MQQNFGEGYCNVFASNDLVIKYASRRKLCVREREGETTAMLTAINGPISTEANTTPKKAPIQAMKSSLSIFQMRMAASMSMSPTTADRMMEANIAFGVYLNSGVITSRVSNTTIDITIFETAVLQPAMKFTAEREKDPAISS